MTPDRVEEAAQALCKARRDGRQLSGLPEGLTPRDMDEAYAVQAAFMRLWDAPLAGWKAGATARSVQDLYGVGEPFLGPFFAPEVFPSPARVKAADFPPLCIETEFAFRFGADMPARDERYTREEILGAVEMLVPAFELISPRFDTLLMDRVALATADCGLNGGFVLGAPYADWRALDLAAHPVRLTVGGEQTAEGTGARALGDPFNVLEWMVNAMARRGFAMKAGDVLSTGTCTGITYLEPGQAAVADFGVAGRIEVRFD